MLHNVPEDLSDALYTKLHKAMENAGFFRYLTVQSDFYQLPPAEYFHPPGPIAKVVWDKANAAANSVDRANGMLMTEGTIYFQRLKRWDATQKAWT